MTDSSPSDAPALLTGSNAPQSEPARNEPCPCGSGKKYKRCHGVSAAPKLSAPKAMPEGGMPGPGGMPAMPPGLENIDPAMMTQASQMLQRLPKGQLQRLQSLMQRAMAGKDVAREAEEFQRTLPPEFQAMLGSFAAMSGAGGMPGGTMPEASAPPSVGMSEEEARAIVEKAAKEGKISKDQADTLLVESPNSSSPKGFGKLWKNLTSK